MRWSQGATVILLICTAACSAQGRGGRRFSSSDTLEEEFRPSRRDEVNSKNDPTEASFRRFTSRGGEKLKAATREFHSRNSDTKSFTQRSRTEDAQREPSQSNRQNEGVTRPRARSSGRSLNLEKFDTTNNTPESRFKSRKDDQRVKDETPRRFHSRTETTEATKRGRLPKTSQEPKTEEIVTPQTEKPTSRSSYKATDRGRGTARAPKSESNPKSETDEVTDEDNYPEVYKQLKKAGSGPQEILALLKAKKEMRVAQQKSLQNESLGRRVEKSTAASLEETTEKSSGLSNFRKSLRQRGNLRSRTNADDETHFESTGKPNRETPVSKNAVRPGEFTRASPAEKLKSRSEKTSETSEKPKFNFRNRFSPRPNKISEQEVTESSKIDRNKYTTRERLKLPTRQKENLEDREEILEEIEQSVKNEFDLNSAKEDTKNNRGKSGFQNDRDSLKVESPEKIETTEKSKFNYRNRFTPRQIKISEQDVTESSKIDRNKYTSRERFRFPARKKEEEKDEILEEIEQSSVKNEVDLNSVKEDTKNNRGKIGFQNDRGALKAESQKKIETTEKSKINYRSRFTPRPIKISEKDVTESSKIDRSKQTSRERFRFPARKEEEKDEILEEIEQSSVKNDIDTVKDETKNNRDSRQDFEERDTLESPQKQSKTKYVPKNHEKDLQRFRARTEKNEETSSESNPVQLRYHLYDRDNDGVRRKITTRKPEIVIKNEDSPPRKFQKPTRPSYVPPKKTYTRPSTTPVPLARYRARKQSFNRNVDNPEVLSLDTSEKYRSTLIEKEGDEFIDKGFNGLSIDSLVSESEQTSISTEALDNVKKYATKRPTYKESHIQKVPPKRRDGFSTTGSPTTFSFPPLDLFTEDEVTVAPLASSPKGKSIFDEFPELTGDSDESDSSEETPFSDLFDGTTLEDTATTTEKIVTTPTVATTTTTTTTTVKPTTTTIKTTTKKATRKPTPKPTPKTTKRPTTKATSKPTTTSTTTTTTTTTTTPEPTTVPEATDVTSIPTTIGEPSTQAITTTTTTEPTTSTKKPTTTTKKPTTTTKKPTTTTKKPTTTTKKPTTTTKKPTTTTKKPTTTTKKPSTTTKRPVTTTKKVVKTTKATTTSKPSTTTVKSSTTTASTVKTNPPVAVTYATTPPTTTKPATQKIITILSTLAYLAQNFTTSKPTTYSNSNTANFVLGSTTTTTPEVQNTTDYVVYGLLPNNNLVRKVVRTTASPVDVPFIIYGLYPNGTIVRRYPNGTILPEESPEDDNEVIANIEPGNKENLETAVKKDSPLAYLYPPGFRPSSTTAFSTITTTPSISTTTPTTAQSVIQKINDMMTLPPLTTLLTEASNLFSTTEAQKPSTERVVTITTRKPTPTTVKTSQKPTAKPTTATTKAKKSTVNITPKPVLNASSKEPVDQVSKTTLSSTTVTTSKPTTTKPTTTSRPSTTTKSTTTSKATTVSRATTTTKPTTTSRPSTTTSKATTTTKSTTTTKPTTTAKPTTTSTSTTTLKSTTTSKTTTTTSKATTTTSKPKSKPKPKTKKTTTKAPSTSTKDISDLELLNNLLIVNQGVSSTSSSPTTEESHEIANKVIQLAIQRAQTTQKSTNKKSKAKPTTKPTTTSPKPTTTSPKPTTSSTSTTSETSSTPVSSTISTLPEAVNVTVSPTMNSTGKISLWVIPPDEANQSPDLSDIKLSGNDVDILNALLSAPNATNSLSDTEQLLLADIVNSTRPPQKKKKKKPKSSTTTTTPAPPFPILRALFGRSRGGNGGLFQGGLLQQLVNPRTRAPPSESIPSIEGGLFQANSELGSIAAESTTSGILDVPSDLKYPGNDPENQNPLVGAAINVTRAVSQFMGFVIQGATQSFQNYLQTRTKALAQALAYPPAS